MNNPVHILLQTTIPAIEDDWNIDRFSLLRDHLSSIADEQGRPRYEVTTRNREEDAAGNDPLLSTFDDSNFDELWLFAVDTGDGLTKVDCEGITRFHKRGGGILSTRDHQDLGSSLCTLGGVGRAHFFHSRNLDPDESRHVRDDPDNQHITWPNYHSGANGNYQKITVVEPAHELVRSTENASGMIEYFPAHPHEGSVGLPDDADNARVVAMGLSQATGHNFNLVVALDGLVDKDGNRCGRAVAESSFHHFVDYNWDIAKGCPSFLLEPPGDEIRRDPSRMRDIKTYVANLASWLAPS
ncbi:MAG TPA: hypothetical protein VJP89_00875 [Pyrinomonadaceae bacterium]|nr:hypothetical protein [Pyrinomonadaceae bacterium]